MKIAPVVAGLDLSLTSTGLAWTGATVDVGRIRSTGRAEASLAERHERLLTLSSRIVLAVEKARCVLVVVEQPAFSRTTGHMHDRSGLWWMVVRGLIVDGVPVAEVTPSALKKFATGKGNASKDEVLIAALRRFPAVDVTGNDTADALILAAMGADHMGRPLVEMPAKHREALDAVRWPEVAARP